ncbi:MAG: hypothetical protein PWR30_310 [Candidatus Woesearchaeota archaeon]|nr:hypothetical protein [Candidatus Woesearchaeota archaeon]
MSSFGFSITGDESPQSSQIRIWQGTSTSISHSIMDWTSVSCSIGNNPYTCSYYIGTSSDPAFCQYEGNYYFQWRFEGKNYEGTSNVWYYTDSSGNYVVRTSSSPSGVFMYNITYDADSNDCECKVGTGRFNIGGEISGCCGDDGSEYVCGGVGDNTLDYYYQDPDSDDKACCDSSTDCVYNNKCYPANSEGPSVDQDSDPDWCGYPGTWRDCNTDAQCGGGAIFGDYEICVNNNCTVDCYNKPCIAGNSTCYDEVLGETLYCMNSTSSATQSSYVENPIGGNTNERYCHQDEYYDHRAGSCKLKEGKDFCYNYLDPSLCGTGNTASVVDCGLVGKYCSFETGEVEDIVIIKSTKDPQEVVGTGLLSPTNTPGECIETDDGDDPRQWGCAYIMQAEDNDDGEVEDGEEDDDFQAVRGEIGCDYVSGGNLVEFYCSGDKILAKNYTCTILGNDSNTSYCFETPSPSDSEEISDPPTRKTPKKTCIPDCEGKECGGDGCGGSCGSCDSGERCLWGQCVALCTPNCEGKECGDDGCGGSCGYCNLNEICSNGKCISSSCTPSCGSAECGYVDDGCGGTIYCGSCPLGETCSNGKCIASASPPTPIKPPGYTPLPSPPSLT